MEEVVGEAEGAQLSLRFVFFDFEDVEGVSGGVGLRGEYCALGAQEDLVVGQVWGEVVDFLGDFDA